ncbi:MAG: hypothetical protein Q8L24_03045 [bacterium]|nr:hypothetical protein [bacterium]
MRKQKLILKKIISWIRIKVPEPLGVIVPVSGGSDSALCWWLCNQALSGKTLGVFSGKGLRREDWFRKHGELRFIETPVLGKNPEIARWSEFLEISVREKRVLIGTRNRTEDMLGTYSLASRIATVLPLAGIWKSDVIDLCRSIGVPKEIINSSRRADPVCGRPAGLADIPLELIDGFLKAKEGEEKRPLCGELTQPQRDYLEEIYSANRFKISLPEKGPTATWFRKE